MIPFASLSDTGAGPHLVITDSGMGGLAICAQIERNLRQAGKHPNVRLTYFNAWPEPQSGYNDMPGMPARASVFDRVLVRMARMEPDGILIACNTLSILYGTTEFSRTQTIPVMGIIESGVDLFCEALQADPQGSIVVLGTRTTIDAHVHRDEMVKRGIVGTRVETIACHGLAAAIEEDPDGPAVASMVEKCASEACRAELPGSRLYAGLACTHYAYAGESIRAAIERRSGKETVILDPNQRMAASAAHGMEAMGFDPAAGVVRVQVISKVELVDRGRRAMAARLEPISAATARALLGYTCDPGLF